MNRYCIICGTITEHYETLAGLTCVNYINNKGLHKKIEEQKTKELKK